MSVAGENLRAEQELPGLVGVERAEQIRPEADLDPGRLEDLQRADGGVLDLRQLGHAHRGEAERRSLLPQGHDDDERGHHERAVVRRRAWRCRDRSECRAPPSERRIRQSGGSPGSCAHGPSRRCPGARSRRRPPESLPRCTAGSPRGSAGDATPPETMILIWCAPLRSSSRMALRTSLGPSATWPMTPPWPPRHGSKC